MTYFLAVILKTHIHPYNQAGHLAMETLLSLTSKRAGEWFKEELRELGGVEHLIRTITHCTQMFTPDLETWTHPLLEKLSKVDRCLKVIENVSVLEILAFSFICYCSFFVCSPLPPPPRRKKWISVR